MFLNLKYTVFILLPNEVPSGYQLILRTLLHGKATVPSLMSVNTKRQKCILFVTLPTKCFQGQS